jgi:hypothetical protein
VNPIAAHYAPEDDGALTDDISALAKHPLFTLGLPRPLP